MKKIVLALMVCGSAVAVHAAKMSWQLFGVYDGTETKVDASYHAYLFTTTVAAIDSWSSIKGSESFSTAAGKGYELTLVEAGKYTDTTSLPSHSALGLGLTGGETYSFYALIANSDYTKYYTSNEYSKLISGASEDVVNIILGNQATATKNVPSAWKTVESVPEPFSGTLALLGMGVVALRRKMKKQKKA